MGHTNDRSTKASSLVNPTSLNLQPRPFAPLESDEKEEAVSRKSGYSENFLEKIINTPRSESATPVQRKSGNRLKVIAAERANAALQNQSIQRQEAVEEEKSEGEQKDGKEFTMNPEPPPVQRKFENRLRAKNAQKMAIQAKLAIGEPNDKYEQEADATAARVVQQINSSTTSQSQPVQRQELEEDEELQMKPLVQRSENLGGGEASTDLESSIQSARGGGQSLDPNLQESMGQAMGADFSGVKVHTDSQSDQLNKSIQAKAFTTGKDVFFRQGAYEPGSRGGQELIAHELTHVVQQNGGAVQRSQSDPSVQRETLPDEEELQMKPLADQIQRVDMPKGGRSLPLQPKLSIGAPGDKYEQEADRVAQQVVQRLSFSDRGQSANGKTLPPPNQTLQREVEPDEEDELQMKPLVEQIQRMELPDDDELQMKPFLQREVEPDEEDELQMKPDSLQREVELDEEDELQMKPLLQRQGSGAVAASDDLESAIQQSRGSGQPLADSIREPMEQAFGGVDFRGVNVHTDGRSDQLNQSIQAKAFTTGQDIFFRQGFL